MIGFYQNIQKNSNPKSTVNNHSYLFKQFSTLHYLVYLALEHQKLERALSFTQRKGK